MLKQNKQMYDTKTIAYNEDGPGEYVIMIVKFNPNSLLRRKGWSDGSCMFISMEPGRSLSYGDPHKFSREFTAADDDHLVRFLTAIERSGVVWRRIVDGDVYTPEKIDELIG